MRKQPVHRPGEKGLTAFVYILSLVFIILPMLGLAIDVGFLYAVRAKMQSAVDGAALAAARALSIGVSLDAQTTSAKNNAVTWFNADFPSNYFGVASVNMSASNVNVFNDPNNAQLRNVTVSATAVVNTIFMRWLGQNSVTVGATGNASRRTVVAMLVLDRSGSMCKVGGTQHSPCSETNTTYPCAAMIKAAKQFTGSFAATSDYIGVLSFSDNVYIHSLPTQNFQSTLGYTNSSGSGTGELDDITCNGYTGTAQGMSMAYQALEQMNLPGALNVIVLETDGLPNSLTMSFYDSTNNVAGLTKTGSTASTCTDNTSPTAKTYKNGGFNKASVIPSWVGGMSLVSSPFSTYTGTGVPYGTLTNYMVGEVLSDDPGISPDNFYMLLNYFANSRTYSGGSYNYGVTSYASPAGCGFNSAHSSTSPTDIAWFPATDVYSNSLNPSYGYKTVTTDAQGHVTQNGWSNYHNGALNATENSAYRARTNTTTPITVFAIGLGGNGPIDPVLLQRMANDPDGDQFNSPTQYDPCASETDCATFTPTKLSNGAISNPQGTFVYAPAASNLSSAFLQISSQVLRLSK